MVKPYFDNGDIRTFDVDESQDEYVWHRDKEDREVEVLSGDGWQLQIDGCLPFLLAQGLKFNIPKMTYHRLIKGINRLEVKITKELD